MHPQSILSFCRSVCVRACVRAQNLFFQCVKNWMFSLSLTLSPSNLAPQASPPLSFYSSLCLPLPLSPLFLRNQSLFILYASVCTRACTCDYVRERGSFRLPICVRAYVRISVCMHQLLSYYAFADHGTSSSQSYWPVVLLVCRPAVFEDGVRKYPCFPVGV